MYQTVKLIAWDLIFYFIVIFLGILGIITILTGVFPNIVVLNQEISCRNRYRSYCTVLLCGSTPNFDLAGCEKFVGTKNPSREDCEKAGFKCS